MGKINQIGVNISDASIEMIQVSKAGKSLGRVVTHAVGEIPAGVIHRGIVKDEEKLAKALETTYAATKQKPFTTKDVCVSLPDHVAFTHIFKFPGALNEDDVASTLKFEAEDIIPYAIDELYITFQIIKQNEEATHVLFVGAPQTTIDAYVSAIEMAGLRLKQLETEAGALIRSLIKSVGKDKAVLILDLGATNTRYTIADEEGLNGSFSLAVGGNNITEAIAKKLSISSREAEQMKRKKATGKKATVINTAIDEYLAKVVNKAKQVADWYAREDTAELNQIILTGGGAGLPEIAKNLAAKFTAKKMSVEISIGNPWQQIDTKTVPKPPAVSGRMFAPALGAVPYIESKLVPDIDLLGVVHKGKNPFKKIRSAKKTVDAIANEPSSGKDPLSLRKISTLINQYNHVFAIVALAVIIGAIGFLVYWLMFAERDYSETTVIIEPTMEETTAETLLPNEDETEVIEGTVNVTIDSEARVSTVVPANLNTVDSYGTTFAYNLDATETVDAIAVGSVILYNNTGTPQPLVATTRLLSEDGVLFRLTEAITVPANSSVEAEVYADVAGASGNIEPTDFTIPGLSESLQEEIYAVSLENMTGGVIEAAIYNEGVYNEVLEALKLELIKTPINLFDSLADDEVLIPELTTITPIEMAVSAEYGDVVASVELTGTVSVTALSFSASNLETVVVEQISELADQNLEILDYTVEEAADDLTSAQLQVTYEIN